MDTDLIDQIRQIAIINGHDPSIVEHASYPIKLATEYLSIRCKTCETCLYGFYKDVYQKVGESQQALYDSILTPCGAVITVPQWTNEILSELGYEILVREFLRVGIEKL